MSCLANIKMSYDIRTFASINAGPFSIPNLLN